MSDAGDDLTSLIGAGENVIEEPVTNADFNAKYIAALDAVARSEYNVGCNEGSAAKCLFFAK